MAHRLKTPLIRGALAMLAAAFWWHATATTPARDGAPDARGKPPVPTAEELPHVKPLSPEEAVKAFRIDPGLKIELAAAEPNVTDPVDIAFDEDGRMWVAELWNYPGEPKQGEPLGRIRLLESTKGDGVYDKSTIFAENIRWPGGVLPWDGGVFVLSSPDLLYLKDTTGSSHANIVKRIYTGFRGKTYEIANCLRWGFDNRIYACGSYAGGSLRPADKPGAPAVDSHDFRFDPRRALAGEPPEAVSGSGEWGNSFNDWNERFTCDATDPVFHTVLDRDELTHNSYLLVSDVRENPNKMWAEVYPISAPEPWKVARQRYWQRWVNTSNDMHAGRFPPTELAPHGFATAAAGVTIYRGSALGGDYCNNSFTAEPANNVVVRMELKEHGASLSADRPAADKAAKREFLASTDDRFRPVNLADGPDGCLYVVSMYREIIEDETAIPDDILKHYDLYSGRDMGRIWRIAPVNFRRPPQPHLSTASRDDLVSALTRPDAWWRDTAQRLLYQRQDRSAIAPLRELARRAGLPQSRIAALWALAGLEDRDPELLAACVGDADPHVRAAALRLSEPVADRSEALAKAVIASADDADARVRFHAALGLGYISRPEALVALARIARTDAADRWTRTAALIAVPDRAGQLLSLLLPDESFTRTPGADEVLGGLAGIVGIRGDGKEVAEALFAIGDPKLSQTQRESLLRQLADGLSRAGGSLAEQLDRAPASVRQSMGALFAEAAKTAGDTSRKSLQRVQAIRLLAFAPRKDTGKLFDELLDPAQPRNVAAAAIAAISAGDDPQVGPTLVKQWSRLGPALRNDVLDALFRRPDRTESLLDAIEKKQIPSGEIEAARRQALLKNKDESIRSRAEKIFAGQVNPDRQRIIEHYRDAVAKLDGDAGRGAVVFKAICIQCHGKAPGAERVGPDLAQLEDRSPPTLLVAILDPNREVKPIYVSYELETVDGEDYLGVVANETVNSVTLRRAGGIEEAVLRSRIKTLRSTGLSLMPDGLEAGIKEQQMADLLQYLRDFREH